MCREGLGPACATRPGAMRDARTARSSRRCRSRTSSACQHDPRSSRRSASRCASPGDLARRALEVARYLPSFARSAQTARTNCRRAASPQNIVVVTAQFRAPCLTTVLPSVTAVTPSTARFRRPRWWSRGGRLHSVVSHTPRERATRIARCAGVNIVGLRGCLHAALPARPKTT